MKKTLLISGIALAAIGCTSHKATGESPAITPEPEQPVVVESTTFIPKATAFKMSGAYADKVAVTLGSDGRLLYFPAPSDITSRSVPTYLANGWWLNNQGLGANSVFTSWTFDEYAKLPFTPSAEEIKAHIIPGATVTDFFKTSVPLTDAASQLAKIKAQLP